MKLFHGPYWMTPLAHDKLIAASFTASLSTMNMHCNDEDADVTISAKDGIETEIHKNVAISASRVFRDCLETTQIAHIPLERFEANILKKVFQYMYLSTPPSHLPPFELAPLDCIPFLEISIFINFRKGISYAKSWLENMICWNDIGLKVTLLCQFHHFFVQDETADMEEQLLTEILFCAQTEQALELPLTYALILKRYVEEDDRWDFISRWLQHQLEQDLLSEKLMNEMLNEEYIPMQHSINLFSLSVCTFRTYINTAANTNVVSSTVAKIRPFMRIFAVNWSMLCPA